MPADPNSTDFASSDARWRAVVDRDPRCDGKFYYSVATTGVFCRPSCPSRRPNRANVSFHSTCAEALAAGFRPCKRCKPTEANPAEQITAQVESLCRLIESREDSVSVRELASHIGSSPSHTHRLFKCVTGVTPQQYAAECRRKRLTKGLTRASSVTQAIYASGYGSATRFYSTARNVLGMTPTRFREGGTAETIHFALAETSLGALLVARTTIGVCAIALGDDPELLLEELAEQFPAAELVGNETTFEKTVATVVGLVEAPRTEFDLPLDIRGTAFQRRVWAALSKIPPGQTVTYSDLAAELDAPAASRAVASACAANKLAVAVPCHRVVRKDGGLSGYRWGVERKAELQKRERSRKG